MSTTAKCLMLVLVGSLLLGGCAAGVTIPNLPANGYMFSDITATSKVTGNAVSDKEPGKSEVVSILGLVALGDASVGTAMKEGGIAKVQRVDYKFFNILGLYAKTTVLVYGE